MAIPDFFQISAEVTHVLANARDSRESIKAILRLLTRSLAWDFGQLWIVDDRRFVLSCVACWPSGSFAKFEQVSMARSFSLGEGLPGSAWQERQCLWKTDVREERNFPRASVAKEEGITSGLAFALHVPEGVLGVMELFSRDERAPDQPVIDFCSALGGQIGVFLEHARLKSELKELDSQLRVLAEGASDAILTVDEHSTILFANSGVYRTFGYTPQELIGKKLTMLMPPEMAHRHELGIQRFVETERRNIPWDGINLPGLHKDGHALQLTISFAEFWREGKRIFTGFAKLAE
jgi:PAS domain S-box-containing protein